MGTAGEERFRGVVPMHFARSQALLVVATSPPRLRHGFDFLSAATAAPAATASGTASGTASATAVAERPPCL
jgi:hypothetical protein